MKYRTIVQINRSDPDLPKVCMIAESTAGSGEKKFSRGLTRLFRRNTQKYNVSKMERRSVSETNLVRCSSLTESDKSRLQVLFTKLQRLVQISKA